MSRRFLRRCRGGPLCPPDSFTRCRTLLPTLEWLVMRPLLEFLARALGALLKGRTTSCRTFRLKTVITKGEGLAIEGDWGEVRSLIYEGRGG